MRSLKYLEWLSSQIWYFVRSLEFSFKKQHRLETKKQKGSQLDKLDLMKTVDNADLRVSIKISEFYFAK